MTSRLLLLFAVSLAVPACREKTELATVEVGETSGSTDVAEAPSSQISYPIVTRHVENGQPTYTNDLAQTASPYLLRLAHSPVKFQRWGMEAFEAARAKNRPVLLTIGSLGCADCADLAALFDDVALAKSINASYEAVAVDAAEHPEIAEFYAGAAVENAPEKLPLIVWATGSGDAWHMAKDVDVAQLQAQAEAFKVGGDGRIARLADAARARYAETRPGKFSRAAVVRAADAAERKADDVPADFIRYMFRAADDAESVNRAVTRLNAVIDRSWDPVGGGFFNVSDNGKSLARNAMLLRTLTEGWQRSQNPLYRRLAERTGEFILRELVPDEGVFFASMLPTAPTHYQWSDEALAEAAADVKIACDGRLAELCAELRTLDADGWKSVDAVLADLREKRSARDDAPPRHEVILTGANGDAIDALAYAGFALDKPAWIDAASRAAFVLPADGIQLRRSAVLGRATGDASGDDIARVVRGLLTVFQYSTEAKHFRRAVMLQTQLTTLYSFASGDFSVEPQIEPAVLGMLHRTTSAVNALSLENMMRIDALRADTFFGERTRQLANYMHQVVIDDPLRHGEFLAGAALAGHEGLVRVAVLGDEPAALLGVVRVGHFPRVVLGLPGEVMLLPWLGPLKPRGRTTAYVCGQGGCGDPLLLPPDLARALRQP